MVYKENSVLKFLLLRQLLEPQGMSRYKHECLTTLVSCLWITNIHWPCLLTNWICRCFQKIYMGFPCPVSSGGQRYSKIYRLKRCNDLFPGHFIGQSDKFYKSLQI